MKKLVKNFLILFLVFLVLAGLFSTQVFNQDKPEQVGMNYLIESINQEQVSKIEVEKDKLILNLKQGEDKVIKKEPNQPLSQILADFDVSQEKISQVNIRVKEEQGWDYWVANIFPFLIPILLIIGFMYFMMRGVKGANSKAMMFGQSQAREFSKDTKKKVSFKDVAGADEAKEELKEVVDFLKHPKKFKDLGATIPKGVLLLGNPGTGKTLMARSVAGEADVPFYHISGSEFVEMFVGVGASRVRSLFQKAKKNTPCLIFIDEIDAVGRKRGAGLGGSHDEREQTLNQILVEMDGFESDTNIIIIAATNRPDVLDPALLRPGRFDRRITIDNPDIREREIILKVHSKKKVLAKKDINLRTVAERTPGFSGADLANLLNEAAILAARRSKKEVGMDELTEAIEKVLIGPERKSRIITEREKKVTAYHEAGHALVAHLLPKTDPVHKVSIVSRGGAGGYTLKLPSEDVRLQPKSKFMEELSVLLAGYFSEKMIFGEVTTGASSDLRSATSLARSLITEYGMSEKLGSRTFGQKDSQIFLGKELHEDKDYSEKTAQDIDEEIANFIDEASKKTQKLLKDKKQELEKIASTLLEKETLEKDQFEEIVGKKDPSKNKE